MAIHKSIRYTLTIFCIGQAWKYHLWTAKCVPSSQASVTQPLSSNFPLAHCLTTDLCVSSFFARHKVKCASHKQLNEGRSFADADDHIGLSVQAQPIRKQHKTLICLASTEANNSANARGQQRQIVCRLTKLADSLVYTKVRPPPPFTSLLGLCRSSHGHRLYNTNCT